MSANDGYLLAISCLGIGCSIWLIARLGIQAFFGLLCGALLIGLATGLGFEGTVAAIIKGFGDILGSAGLVVSLGLGLGAVLQISGGAQALARAIFDRTGEKRAPLGALLAALVLGFPLFFETGVVLLLPIIAAGFTQGGMQARRRLTVMLSALAGLAVLHALMPPHPGPLVAAGILHAPISSIIPIGLVAAIPTALIAGPLLARFTTRHVGATTPPVLVPAECKDVSPVAAAIALLFPVVLIAAGAVVTMAVPAGGNPVVAMVAGMAEPVTALMLAIVVALILMFPRRLMDRDLHQKIWTEALHPAAGIILSIGAGGSLKQVLVAAGLPDVFGKLASAGIASPLLIAWMLTAAIRVATGSSTVATITAAGIMSGIVAGSAIPPQWFVLAIGTGSLFLSHVNDPGFWLVRGYLGTGVIDTLKLWSVMASMISVLGFVLVLLLYWLMPWL